MDKQTSQPKLSDFFTRADANEGIKLPLTLPDGTETEHFINIRSVDSDEYKIAEMNWHKSRIQCELEGDALTEYALGQQRKLTASLIIGWSIDAPCSEKAKLELIREAPQIADDIQRKAEIKSLFVKKKSSDSLKSLDSTSSSPSQSKGQKSQSKKAS